MSNAFATICAYAGCQQPIPDITECNIVTDDLSAWILHPECYEKWRRDGAAKYQASLLAKQAVERKKMHQWNMLSKPRLDKEHTPC